MKRIGDYLMLLILCPLAFFLIWISYYHYMGHKYFRKADKFLIEANGVLADGIENNDSYSKSQIDSIVKKADSLKTIGNKYVDTMNYYYDKQDFK